MILNGACGSLSRSGRSIRLLNHSASLPPMASGSGVAGDWARLVAAAADANPIAARTDKTLRIESSSRGEWLRDVAESCHTLTQMSSRSQPGNAWGIAEERQRSRAAHTHRAWAAFDP